MKILIIDTFHYPRGGSSLYALSLSKLLRDNGHKVFHFAMAHPKSLPSETEKYWVSFIDYPELLEKGLIKGGFTVLRRTIYSRESARNLRKLIADFGPFDIAHINNIMHHLTPSVFDPLVENKIPIVWTLHDFSVLCPNTFFFNERLGANCTRCLGGGFRFLNAPIARCKKGSFSASAMACIESISHMIFKRWEKPDLFIVPGGFHLSMLLKAGFKSERIEIVQNFVQDGGHPERETVFRNPYALYAGRLSPEKGLESAIVAWKKLPAEYSLKIAGSGPSENKLKSLAEGAENIEFMGFIQPDKLSELRRGALFAIVPSVCLENAPLTILESFSDEVPVLASNIGGIPDIVDDGENGILFEPGNSEDIASHALLLFAEPEKCAELGKNARKKYLAEYTPERHFKKLETIYRRFTKG